MKTVRSMSSTAILSSAIAAGATPKGRDKLAETTGIGGKLILEWTNHCDLMRLKGVGSEYSDLFEAAGVDSPAELAQRNVANLTAAMAKYNEAHKIVRRTPSEKEVTDRVAEAKELPGIVEHGADRGRSPGLVNEVPGSAERPHRGLSLAVPAGARTPQVWRTPRTPVERRDVLGGLIHEDRRAA